MKVRDVLRLLTDDGWYLARTRGSHHQFRHPAKPGLVTVAGAGNDDLAPGTPNSILKQAGLKRPGPSGGAVSRYLIIVEPTATGFSAYSPDVPGCVATARTREEVEQEMRQALAFHLDGLREEGLAVPPPTAAAAYVEVAA